MQTYVFLVLVLLTTIAKGQSPCDDVKLYDQMVVKGYQPMFHKLKRFDIKLIPEVTLLKMKNEIIAATYPEFFSGVKIKSVKLFDSAVATAWSWTHEPIVDNNSNPVYFFYSVLFETAAANGTPFVFRIDVLRDGELLSKKQIAFLMKGKLDIIGCEKLKALVLADTVQPIHVIDEMALAYSPEAQAVIWIVASVVDQRTGIQYFKEVNAVTGAIVRRSFADLNTPPKVEEIKFR